jgi:hypothetical protein
MVNNIAFATFSGSRDQIVINLIKENDTYRAFINGEIFPLVAALYAIDRVGYVVKLEEFIELAKFHRVELIQYQNPNNHNEKPFLLA